jgi:hypothetical protein
VENQARGLAEALEPVAARRLPRLILPILFALAAIAGLAMPAAAQTRVDLELVIAVDVSLSMDLDEQRLQREGYVAAFRDEEIHKAIVSGSYGRIAVTYVEWAGAATQSVVIPWTILDGPAAARAFADRLEKVPITRARLTSISSALAFSRTLFASSGAAGVRRVIDVSGDGPNNDGLPVVLIRDEVVSSGIVINGLPLILKEPLSSFDIPDLDQYYAHCVIGGSGAFIVPVRELSEFKLAIRRKLLLEISGWPLAHLIPAQYTAPTEGGDYDCLVGEKRWRGYYFPDRGPN